MKDDSRDNFKHFVLYVTNSCNLRCDYCYVDIKDKKISNEVLLKEVDEILNTDYQKIEIEFLGGEPLLNIKGIKKVCEYVEENSDKIIRYSIVTNGTIFNEEIKEVINKFNFDIVGVSIDGTKFIHNYHRKDIYGKGSYHKVEKNINKFLDLNVNIVNAQITLSMDTAGYFEDNINHLFNLGFKNINVNIVKRTLESSLFDIVEKQFKNIIKKYKNKIKMSPFMDNIEPKITENFKKNSNNFMVETYKRKNLKDLEYRTKIYYEGIIRLNEVYNTCLREYLTK